MTEAAWCTSCGARWSEGAWSEGCAECGGGALERPCARCGGACGGQSRRAVMDSNDMQDGHWIGGCLFTAFERELLEEARVAGQELAFLRVLRAPDEARRAAMRVALRLRDVGQRFFLPATWDSVDIGWRPARTPVVLPTITDAPGYRLHAGRRRRLEALPGEVPPLVNGELREVAFLSASDELTLGAAGWILRYEVDRPALELPRVSVEGPDAPRRVVALQIGENVLGRYPENRISLTDHASARRHAVINVEGSSPDFRVTVVDMGSSNGTFVNEQRIESREVQPGDRIGVGSTTILLLRDSE